MPTMYIIAGSNGAGKTTVANSLFHSHLSCYEFVDPAAVGGRRAIEVLNRLIDKRTDFAFETSLAGRFPENLLRKAQDNGYEVVLLFLWLSSPELAIARANDRREADILNGYRRGLVNMINRFIWLCNYWLIIDNSQIPYEIVAEGEGGVDFEINDVERWCKLKQRYDESCQEL